MSRWSVAKSADGFWLVEEWLPDDSVATARGGYFRTKTEALEYMRLKKAAQEESDRLSITGSVEVTAPGVVERLRKASAVPPLEVKGGRHDGLKVEHRSSRPCEPCPCYRCGQCPCDCSGEHWHPCPGRELHRRTHVSV